MKIPFPCFAPALAFILTITLPAGAQTPGTRETYNPKVAGINVLATALQPDGKLIIGGTFTAVGDAARANIARLNADGTVDASFTSSSNGEFNCVAVQADGKIVLGGNFTVNGSENRRIARLNEGGSLDTTFSVSMGENSFIANMAVQTDGKIVLVGGFGSVNGTARNKIARLNADGSLDTTFNPGIGANDNIYGVAVQADGKILLGGRFTNINGTLRKGIARLNPDGSMEPTGTFDPSTFDPAFNSNNQVSCVAVQADGKIVLGGSFTYNNGTARSHISRLNADGSLDSSFNPGTGADSPVRSLAIQADGKIVLGGSFTKLNGTVRNRIARLHADGSLESTATFNPGTGADNWVDSVAVQVDGKIVLGGSFSAVNGTAQNRIARLANDPAPQTLTAADARQALWTRSGSAPEVSQATFDLSTDGGTSWTPLGAGSRVGTTANWQITGLDLPTSGWLRARGRTASGFWNAGSGLVESLASFNGLIPGVPAVFSVSPTDGNPTGGTAVIISGMGFSGASTVSFGGTAATSFSVTDSTTITAIAPAHMSGQVSVNVSTARGTNTANVLYTYLGPPTVTTATVSLYSSATALKITGGNFSTTPGNNTVLFTPAGSGKVTASTPTSLQVTGLTGLTPGALNAVVTTIGQSSGTAVQVATVVPPPAGALESFDPNVVGGPVYVTAAQPDGKMLIGGFFSTVGGAAHAGLARLNADGSVDASFNANSDGTNWGVYSLAVQTDGKIVLGRYSIAIKRMARLNKDGSLDTTFRSGTGANGTVRSVAVQADGKIVLGGDFTEINNTPVNRIARLNADGSLESTATFNPGTGAAGTVRSVAVQPDGKILLGGAFTMVDGTARSRIARLNTDGTLDNTFNANFRVDGDVHSVVVQADGKIVIGLDFLPLGVVNRNYILRLNPNGGLESTQTFNPGILNGGVRSMALQVDGKIVLGGDFTTVDGTSRNRIARLNPNGSLDSNATFNPGTGTNGIVRGVAVQADGKIVLSGEFDTVNGTTHNRIARLTNDPATQTLVVLDPAQVLWTRGGSAPEVSQVTFELSTDGSATWMPIGAGTRAGTTANWQITGLSLPASGQLRARGRMVTGYNNGSSGLLETVSSFSGLTPRAPIVTSINPSEGIPGGGTTVIITGMGFTGASGVSFGGTAATSFSVIDYTTIAATAPAHAAGVVSVDVTTPSGTNLANKLYVFPGPPTVTESTGNLPGIAATLTLTGTNFSTTPGNNTIVFTPAGSGTVTASTSTSLKVTSLTGLTPGALNAVVTTFGQSSGAPVQVATVITPPAGTLEAFDPDLIGVEVDVTALQPDGKMIIGGFFSKLGGTAKAHLARLHADGSVDASFTANTNGAVYSTAVQVDGKIVMGGYFTAVNGMPRHRIARLDADGSLDTTFASGAVADNAVNCVMVQADGKLVLSGNFNAINGTARYYIARLHADGSLESTDTFNPGAGTNGPVNSVAVQADGKLVLGGSFTFLNDTAAKCVARLNADGSMDTSFNPGTGADGPVDSVVVQADGKIVLGGGFSTFNNSLYNKIARLNVDGSLDSTFMPGTGPNSSVHSLAVQVDGKIVLGGAFTTVNGTARNRIARLNADGSLDTSCNPGTGANDTIRSVALQPDGKIVLGGFFNMVNGTTHNKIARLANDPAQQTLTTLDATRARWTRSGSAPEVLQASFELSTDGGATWMPLGSGTRVDSANWQLTGLSLPAGGQLRARGRTSTGYHNGSSGLVETATSFSGLTPVAPIVTSINPKEGSPGGGTGVTITGMGFTGASTVSFGGTPATSFSVINCTTIAATAPAHVAGVVSVDVATPYGTNAANPVYTYPGPPTVTASMDKLPTIGTALTITGSNFSSTAADNSVVFTPAGSGIVSASTSTSLKVTGLSGLTPGALSAVVTTFGQSSGAPVRVRQVFIAPAGTLEAYDPYVNYGEVYATAVQPDGKMLIGGFFSTVGNAAHAGLARLNADGSVDASFNAGSDWPNWGVYSLAVQTDGKIVVGGNGTGRNRIARLNPDGSLESTATFNSGTGPNESVSCVTVQADGKIVLGGFFNLVNGTARNSIARLNADGSLDTTFNPGTGANGAVICMAVQADGKILVGGSFTYFNGTARNRIARLNADGSLDTTFNPGTGANFNVNIVIVQADGKTLLGGDFTHINSTARKNLARLNVDGSLESTATFDPGISTYNQIDSVALQADGKLVLGGIFSENDGTARKFFLRLNPNGRLESTATFVPVIDPNLEVTSLAVQADGKLLLSGRHYPNNGTSRNRIARLANDPAQQTLTAPDAVQALWIRGGSAPEVSQVTFDLSVDGGTIWTPLGTGTRVGSTSNWQRTGLNLPASGKLRARGRTSSGYRNSSSGLVETVASFGSPTGAGFAGWAAFFGLVNDPNASGVNGLKNLLNFAFGQSPSVSALNTLGYTGNVISPGSPRVKLSGNIPTAEFVRRKDYTTAGLTYSIQFSADLSTWETAAATPSVLADDGTLQVVGLSFPPMPGGAQAGYFRVSVSMP